MSYKRVISASMLSGGTSILTPYELPLGNVWELVLDCGHTAYRPVRYINVSQSAVGRKKWGRRSADDARPAPKKIKCLKCKEG